MARTIDYWYQQIVAAKAAKTELNGLDSTSAVSDFSLWAFIVASVMWVLDNLFDLHKAEVDTSIAALKPHSLTWYQTLALRFQYGQDTIPGTDQYANTGLTSDQIAAQLIIAQAAVTEVSTSTFIGLRVKVVKLVENSYAQLDEDELNAFKAFLNKQKDAGVNILAQSPAADGLKLTIEIFYDPLILKGDGSRIDGTVATPVNDGIAAYLKSLPYNGEYANTRLSNALQQVSGVVLVNIKVAQAQFGAFPYTNIDERYVPDGGYLALADGNPVINYVPYV